MSNRSARFVSAIFATILAGTNVAAVAENGEKKPDSCLSSPKGALPAGGHWYYRVDRATKRHCWYIGEEKDKAARVAPPDSAASPAPATDPLPPQQTTSARKSIANARAELPSPQARVNQDAGVNVRQRTSSSATTQDIENSQRMITPDASAQTSVIASRWPDASEMNSSNSPAIAAADPPANPQKNAKATPLPANASVAPAVAESALEKKSDSMQMLLIVMVGALALAGLTASAIYRFGRARAIQPEVRGDRREIWDPIDPDRSSPSIFPSEDAPTWHSDVRHDPRAPDDPDRRIADMLQRLARSAAN